VGKPGGPSESRGPLAVLERRRRVRSRVAALLLAYGALVGVAGAWRRLAPPVEFKPPRPLTADMVFIRTGPGAAGAPEGFWLDRFETTVEEFDEFLLRTGRALGERGADSSAVPPDSPIVRVTHQDASAFATWRGKRLPETREWDRAARGPAGTRFPWGDAFVVACANTRELGLFAPTRVGTFENGRSQAGVYDLHGNVAEWTATRDAGLFDERFLIRGSSCLTPGDRATFDLRGGPARGGTSDAYASDVGFRCAADVSSAEEDFRLRAAAARLGVRDPAGVVLQRRPAEATLREGGAAARRVLEDLVRQNEGDPRAAGPVERARLLLSELR
jgi:hypothetical protein